MRHPLLRILVAVLLAAWSPLCCCQAAAWAGSACGGPDRVEIISDACCDVDHGAAAARTPMVLMDQHRLPDGEPGGCSTCGTCQDAPALGVESKLPSLEREWNADGVPAACATPAWTMAERAVAPVLPAMADGPPHVRANRAAQRWHCALMV